ncbi:phage head-tail connector protein [Sporosarcina beigongshangi]|uniref:phage head-tail connector protein n=1 Tax=Sporosarcina beigongshangi TaxID=2782538 RepID=UPI0019398FBF|nr:phage head-tail connector protein [Sporosarcina beigongshangi]
MLIYEILARIKRILSIVDVANDDVLTDFIEMYDKAICLHTGTTETPTALEFILTEAVIARWQRMGSEGMKSEKIDIVTQQFTDEVLDSYLPYIQQWKAANQPDGGSSLKRIQFL